MKLKKPSGIKKKKQILIGSFPAWLIQTLAAPYWKGFHYETNPRPILAKINMWEYFFNNNYLAILLLETFSQKFSLKMWNVKWVNVGKCISFIMKQLQRPGKWVHKMQSNIISDDIYCAAAMDYVHKFFKLIMCPSIGKPFGEYIWSSSKDLKNACNRWGKPEWNVHAHALLCYLFSEFIEYNQI